MCLLAWLRRLQRRWFGSYAAAPRRRARKAARLSVRPQLEILEDRLAPSVTTINVNDTSGGLDNAANVTVAKLGSNVTLRDAINAANNTAGSGNSYVINLQANATYDLTAIDNYWYGPDGLPAIFSNITIQGNGSTIQRDTASGTPDFRLFYVSGGLDGAPAGSLTLKDLTLQGGVAQGGNSNSGGGGLGAGGAIFNQGTLALTGVTLTNNQAVGGSSGVSSDGAGGGGMGQDAPAGLIDNGGGFGGSLGGTYGGSGGSGGSGGNGGGGGGFGLGDAGANGTNQPFGGGQGGFGGTGGISISFKNTGDGGSGGEGGNGGNGGNGGGFGSGGSGGSFIGNNSGGGGGGGVGGGGGGAAIFHGPGIGSLDGGGGGGFGGGGGGGFANNIVDGGQGGFGGGGGAGANTGSGGFGGSGGYGGGAGSSGSGSSSSSGGGGGAGMGGGIFSMVGSLTLTNCTLTANTAQGGTGFNGGSGYGGAVFNLDGSLGLTFCTLAANTVTAGSSFLGGINGNADGGAVYNLAFGNNLATDGAQSATATVADSILSNSTGGSDLVNSVVNGKNTNTATVTLSGSNLVQTSSGTIAGTPTATADPQLGPLQNNAGPTPTLAITSSSPAWKAGTTVAGITTDQRNFTRPTKTPSLGAFDPQATPPATTTTASNITTPFSESDQDVTLTAAVSSGAGAVNEGTVTFTVKQGSTILGAATTSGTVSNGAANVSYVLPAGTVAGSYTIDAVYNPGSDFAGSSDTAHKLIVGASATTIAAGNATTPFSDGVQNVMLTATVSSNAGSVNDGTVTFTVKQGNAILGTAVTSQTVSNGSASVSYALPAGTAAGSYTLDAVYNPGADFSGSSDTTHTLTVGVASTTTAASNAATTFSPNAQNVILTAKVSSGAGLVNGGTVTFTVKQGKTILGTATTSNTVSNGVASVSYVLPAGTTAGAYTLDAVYNPGPDFSGSSDTTHTFAVLPSALQLTTISMAPNLLNLTQTETLSAHLFGFAPGGGLGKVSFVVDGQTASANVDGNGNATASVTLPILTAQSPQVIGVTYSGLGSSVLSITRTAFWQSLNAISLGTDTFAADGGQAIQAAVPGMPPVEFLFNAQGLLVEIDIAGFALNISYNSFNETTGIRVNGVLIAEAFYTPQGIFLGAITTT